MSISRRIAATLSGLVLAGAVASGPALAATDTTVHSTTSAAPVATAKTDPSQGFCNPEEDGDLDYASVGPEDASWIAYDPTLGPQLRATPSLSTDYYGFDVDQSPFDDVRVRQAFGAAADCPLSIRWLPFEEWARGAAAVSIQSLVRS